MRTGSSSRPSAGTRCSIGTSWSRSEQKLLGVDVTVVRIDLREDGQIVAICARGSDRQAVGILDLPLSSPLPNGAEWITAYRRWLRGERGQ
jgi:hypothetical protein